MSSLKTILVTGANGQLGMEFRSLALTQEAFRFIFVSKDDLDISDKAAVISFFEENSLYACINCAAYTLVDKAESEKTAAIAINETAPANLAGICFHKNVLFFHFSTDYVFSGNVNVPYTEASVTDPVNYYGQTKLLGEQAVIEINPHAIVIRTSWVYSSFGKNFVKTMLRLMKEKESLGVVADQFGCPTYAADLAAAVLTILDAEHHHPGLYHYCNEGIISWYDFAVAINKLSDSSCRIDPITTADYPTPAKRPHYSALDTSRIRDTFKLHIPAWQVSLEKCLKLL